MKKLIFTNLLVLSVALPLVGHEEHTKGGIHDEKVETAEKAFAVTVRGEIIDMVCYLDHGATGAKHADCAKTCITSGLPVGLKTRDGKIYLLVGEHKPINKTLAPLAAQTVTVKGKVVSRDGFNMIENAEIVQK